MAKVKININLKKYRTELQKVQTLVDELEKLNAELDRIMAQEMYPNFQSVPSLSSFYNTIAGHINNNHEWVTKLRTWNNTQIEITKSFS